MTLKTTIMSGVERLRQFCNFVLEHPCLELVHDNVAWLLESVGAMPARARRRGDTMTLTNAGIRFRNIQYHDAKITCRLLDDLVRDAENAPGFLSKIHVPDSR